MNQCGACNEDFNSVKLFDKHRVGTYAYTYRQGLAMEPMRENGRRCLDVEEMAERGWRVNAKGRWIDPSSAERVATWKARSAESHA